MAARMTIRTPMPIRMRAKQFAMFDAMKGLTEAIAEKEQQFYAKRELDEDRISEINLCLSELQVGDTITLKYYCQYGKQYRELTGAVTRMDSFWKELQVGDVSICFSEVDAITVENGI